ncbi:acetyl-CoA carboxylase biotin carboxyl carrier protein [Limnoglobus roseus]|uniref:Biotin carboxyl carrier protein of acetyl-CoA carboxylase n=1 Tax=Limnoglobus roseus TaxID=2598579 RepID=A0A5C1A7A2_9BACT|nr:acetyl-CoA carboxylase biotin carboxyl carrier protein [Limnoglobus roseus]QEL15149.1 acetyl-CoA carboxylase biotin carboxyl carrier protein subunit [Limnoglobus roseus]
MASENKPDSNRPFDTKMVEFLVKLMADRDLSEIDLHEGEHRIRLRRGARVVTAHATTIAPPPAVPHAAAAQAPAVAPAAATPKSNLHEIKSPMVGTFYAKPSPDKDDYVKVGSKVKPDTVVCKLEAMKLFNDHPAECTGTIAEVCVKNGQPVDFGTVLFRVELG